MSKISDYISLATIFGGLPGGGAAAAVLAGKVTTKYGHTFMHLGPTNSILIGTLGAVHNLASCILRLVWDPLPKDELKIRILSHVLVGGILYGLSALAARIKLIQARLTLPGAVILTVTSLISTLAVEQGAEWLLNKLK